MKHTFRFFADKDLVAAQTLITSGDAYNVAASLMQQALDKMLKYILVLKNKEAPRTHSLLALYNEALPDKVAARRSHLREINSMYFSMRYPNDDYYDVDKREVEHLWKLFTSLYQELEVYADELEKNPPREELTSLFGE